MTDLGTPDNEKTIDVSVRFPKSFLEDELLPAYPEATKATDAIRMAVSNDVKRRQEGLTPEDITQSVIDALDSYDAK